MTDKPRRRWFRFSLRMLFIGMTLAALMLTYIGSYYQRSRRGIQEAKASGSHVIYYVPLEEALRLDDAEPFRQHVRWMAFYAPLNWPDQKFFGGLPPSQGGIRRLIP